MPTLLSFIQSTSRIARIQNGQNRVQFGGSVQFGVVQFGVSTVNKFDIFEPIRSMKIQRKDIMLGKNLECSILNALVTLNKKSQCNYSNSTNLKNNKNKKNSNWWLPRQKMTLFYNNILRNMI